MGAAILATRVNKLIYNYYGLRQLYSKISQHSGLLGYSVHIQLELSILSDDASYPFVYALVVLSLLHSLHCIVKGTCVTGRSMHSAQPALIIIHCITAGITLNELKQKLDSRSTRPDPVKFDSGDAVKMKHLGVVMYGTLQWQGVFPDGVHMAGIEVVSVVRYTAIDICKVALAFMTYILFSILYY